jgi:hypothetical protein
MRRVLGAMRTRRAVIAWIGLCLPAAMVATEASGAVPTAGASGTAAAGADTPATAQLTVVELFTSSGCSSCPPADALLGRLAHDTGLLTLSFHVNYWDQPGWRDPFALQSSTARQYAYAQRLGMRSVYTPQVIVNGTQSLVGSEETAVRRVAAEAARHDLAVKAVLTRRPDGRFALALGDPGEPVEIWEVRYVKHALTAVQGGENRGRRLETFNNVVGLRQLQLDAAHNAILPPLAGSEDGVAILLQARRTGRVLGALRYESGSEANS